MQGVAMRADGDGARVAVIHDWRMIEGRPVLFELCYEGMAHIDLHLRPLYHRKEGDPFFREWKWDIMDCGLSCRRNGRERNRRGYYITGQLAVDLARFLREKQVQCVAASTYVAEGEEPVYPVLQFA